jgi:DNA-binding response OmpR family regulator
MITRLISLSPKKLLKNNYKCIVVDSGIDALDILENETFDIILMDINMPLMNGLKRQTASKGIVTPVIALTAFDKEKL